MTYAAIVMSEVGAGLAWSRNLIRRDADRGSVRARMAVARACATLGYRKETLVNESSQRVRAKVGDVVAIHAHHLGEPERLGEILEVLGRPDHIHFRVRWDDEHESIFYPGNDATVRVHQPRREVRKS